MDIFEFFKSKTNGNLWKTNLFNLDQQQNIFLASHLDLHQKKNKAHPLLANAIPSKNMLKWKTASSSAKISKKGHLAIL